LTILHYITLQWPIRATALNVLYITCQL